MILLKENEIEEGKEVIWYYPYIVNKRVIIASNIINNKRVRINHINKDGTQREGGYVNIDELYKIDK